MTLLVPSRDMFDIDALRALAESWMQHGSVDIDCRELLALLNFTEELMEAVVQYAPPGSACPMDTGECVFSDASECRFGDPVLVHVIHGPPKLRQLRVTSYRTFEEAMRMWDPFSRET